MVDLISGFYSTSLNEDSPEMALWFPKDGGLDLMLLSFWGLK
jgi:hypothetical protein